MENTLKVDEYFSQLPQHGLGVVLVQRSDLYKEITKDNNQLFINKRNRESEEDEDLIVMKTVENLVKFHQMNVPQLDLQANGSKNDPVEIPDDDEISGLVSKKRKTESEEEDLIVIDEIEDAEKNRQMNTRQFSERATICGVTAIRVCDDSAKDTVDKILDDDTNGFVNKMRKTVSDDDVIVIDKVEDVEKFRQTNKVQLSEQATIHGVPTNESEKELLERVCADSLNDSVEIPNDEINDFVNKKKKTEPENDFILVEVVEDVEKLRQMNIFQLGEQATVRGIPTNGSKEELLQRICADPFDEPEKISDEVDTGGKKNLVKSTKKGRAVLNQKLLSEDGDVIMIEKVEDAEKLQELGIRQLREQATLRGVSANGSKKQLLERLCAADVSGKEKLVKATKKGGAVLDQGIPDHIKALYHVLQHGGEIYDAMLNLTNVKENSNKFCVIQALESDDGLTFMVYSRSGRVGAKGHVNLSGPLPLRDTAIRVFTTRFYSKTQVQWSHRKYVVCRPKCYAWLEMDYDENNIAVADGPNYSIQPRVSTLDPRIAKFISLICNVRMMKQQMMEIGYNAEKLPLGKLSKSTILKGYGVLKKISEVIDQSDRTTLEQLSGEFYTVIPHDFGYKKMSEFVIDTQKKLKRKLQMVEALGEIQVATKLLSDGNEGDPIYLNYQRLRCELTAVDIHSEEYSMIERYMRNTHAITHSNYSVDIGQIFRISRHGETERFRKYFCTKNRMLLWHGSRLSNWTGILSQGLRIAPLEAPSSGSMYGKGIYFADMFSKSANYCYPALSTTGVLLLCEVALGDMAEYTAAYQGAYNLPFGKLSTKGVGRTIPNPYEYKVLDDGVIVPLGKPTNTMTGGQLLYNEYIVYNVDQIRMRYVIQVNFNLNCRRAY